MVTFHFKHQTSMSSGNMGVRLSLHSPTVFCWAAISRRSHRLSFWCSGNSKSVLEAASELHGRGYVESNIFPAKLAFDKQTRSSTCGGHRFVYAHAYLVFFLSRRQSLLVLGRLAVSCSRPPASGRLVSVLFSSGRRRSLPASLRSGSVLRHFQLQRVQHLEV